MRAEFYRPDEPEAVVGMGIWTRRGVEIRSDHEEVRAALGRIYRPTPAAADDPALRVAGTSGPVVLPPGELSWFIQVSRARPEAEGLAVRMVSDRSDAMGWDPAAAYRTFSQTVERRALAGQPPADG